MRRRVIEPDAEAVRVREEWPHRVSRRATGGCQDGGQEQGHAQETSHRTSIDSFAQGRCKDLPDPTMPGQAENDLGRTQQVPVNARRTWEVPEQLSSLQQRPLGAGLQY